MIDRLVIAALFVALVLAGGQALRLIARRRTQRLAKDVTLEPAPGGAARMLVFSSRWCADCAAQRDVIEHTRTTWPRPVAISYHDAATEHDLADRLGILQVPAIVIANAAGRVIEVNQGLVDANRLRSLLEAAA